MGDDSGTSPDTGVLTIADAKSKSGQTVTIEGVVTADNTAIGGSGVSWQGVIGNL